MRAVPVGCGVIGEARLSVVEAAGLSGMLLGLPEADLPSLLPKDILLCSVYC